MLKTINRQNFLMTPFTAAKTWELYNTENNDVIVTEHNTVDESNNPIGDIAIAFEFIDHSNTGDVLNRTFDLALEQQINDQLYFEDGVAGAGTFNPAYEATNENGTYKRLVYSQTKSTFYNTYNDPTQIFGLEYIDTQLGRTKRNLSDYFRIFNIPQKYFGDKLLENSIELYDNSLDDNVVIVDDGYQNLTIGNNLFANVQETRKMPNKIA